MSVGLLLLCLCNVVVVVLTAPVRTGDEGPVMVLLAAVAGVLAVGITERVWYAHAPHKRAERD